MPPTAKNDPAQHHISGGGFRPELMLLARPVGAGAAGLRCMLLGPAAVAERQETDVRLGFRPGVQAVTVDGARIPARVAARVRARIGARVVAAARVAARVVATVVAARMAACVMAGTMVAASLVAASMVAAATMHPGMSHIH